MTTRLLVKLTVVYLTLTAVAAAFVTAIVEHDPREEDGFEIAQSMGIALLGLVVAAAFATALKALGVDVITKIRTELGLNGG